MIFRYLPWKIKYPIFAVYLKTKRVCFDNPVSFIGSLPRINNLGIFRLGGQCLFQAETTPPSIFVAEGAALELGFNAYLNDGARIEVRQSVKIGDYVKIGPYAYIFDVGHHDIAPDRPPENKPIIIGKNVWVGARAIILPGSSIGDHSIIGAGAIVKGNIPDRCIAVGCPAKVVKTFDCPDDWIRN